MTLRCGRGGRTNHGGQGNKGGNRSLAKLHLFCLASLECLNQVIIYYIFFVQYDILIDY